MHALESIGSEEGTRDGVLTSGVVRSKRAGAVWQGGGGVLRAGSGSGRWGAGVRFRVPVIVAQGNVPCVVQSKLFWVTRCPLERWRTPDASWGSNSRTSVGVVGAASSRFPSAGRRPSRDVGPGAESTVAGVKRKCGGGRPRIAPGLWKQRCCTGRYPTVMEGEGC